MKRLEERSEGTYRASAGTIYPTLQQLEDEGLVASEERDGKRVYRLTDAGRAELAQRRDTVDRIWERAEDWGSWRGFDEPEAVGAPAARSPPREGRAPRRGAEHRPGPGRRDPPHPRARPRGDRRAPLNVGLAFRRWDRTRRGEVSRQPSRPPPAPSAPRSASPSRSSRAPSWPAPTPVRCARAAPPALAEVARQSFALLRPRAPGEIGSCASTSPTTVRDAASSRCSRTTGPSSSTRSDSRCAATSSREQLLLHPILAVRARRRRAGSLGFGDGPDARRESLHLRRGLPAPRERRRARRASRPSCGAAFATVADVTDDHRRMVPRRARALRRTSSTRAASCRTAPSAPRKICRFLDWLRRRPLRVDRLPRATTSRAERRRARGAPARPARASACGATTRRSRFVEPQRGADDPRGAAPRSLDDPRIILIGKARIESRDPPRRPPRPRAR